MIMNQLVQPAKQDRSRDTQDRILRATKELLENELFESISIRRIIERADTSIGSFYARFRDKDALLPVLYAEYEEQLERHLRRLRESTAKVKSLEQLVELIVQHFIDIRGEIPNLSRALYEYVMRSPDSAEALSIGAERGRQYAFVIDAILKFRNKITHPNPRRAAELGFYFMVVVCRNRILYPAAPQTRMLKISKRELAAELQRLMTGYLTDETVGIND